MTRRPTETDLARHWQRKLARREGDLYRREFVARLDCQPGKGSVLLARGAGASGETQWLGLPAPELLKSHAWIMGATGAGKSFLILGLLWQLLRRGDVPIVLLDLKGELASLLIDLVLPSLLQMPEFERLISTLRIVRPFDPVRVPLLRLTDPEPGVSREVQAMNLASSLEDALGQDLGVRMNRVFLRLVALAIELGEPLTVLTRWLGNPATLLRDSQRSGDPTLREYAREGFPQESASSLDALASRLDTFLFLPETQLALSTPRCFSLPESLDSGLTIIDVGNPPAGAERVARFWGGVLIGRLSRAIMGRVVGEKSPQTLVVLEEFQEALSGSSVEQFGRLLALCRFKKASLWFVNQQPGQLSSVDPALPKLLRTNTGIEMIFRSSFEDARMLGPALAQGSSKRGAEGAPSRAEELTRLPDREYFLWLKKESFGAHRVRSPRLDLPAMRQAAAQVSERVAQRIQAGTVTMTRADLNLVTPTIQRPVVGNRLGRTRKTGSSPSRYPELG